MHQKCPRCKLINPQNAERCDCGYDFPSRTIKESYLDPKEAPAHRAASPGELLVCVVLPLIGLCLGLRARSRGHARAGTTMLVVSASVLALNVTVFLLWTWLERFSLVSGLGMAARSWPIHA